MKLEIYKEADTIWKKAASKSAPGRLTFETDLYKKLLNFFHVGNYYYGIFNYLAKDFEFVSDDVKALLGYSFPEFNVPFLVGKIHTEDIPYFLNYENRAMDFLIQLPVDKLTKYKVRYDYRVQKNNGEYIRLLQQGMVLEHDADGGILRTLIIHTDITHIKPDGKPILSFIGLDGEPSYIDVDAQEVFVISKAILTKREKQILTLLIEGRQSKQISELLNISRQTVDKHRKNMLNKTTLTNTGELIAKAIRQGWL